MRALSLMMLCMSLALAGCYGVNDADLGASDAIGPGAAYGNGLNVFGDFSATPGTCVPLRLERTDSTSQTIQVGFMGGSSEIQMFKNADCGSDSVIDLAGNLSMTVEQREVRVYARTTSAFTGGMVACNFRAYGASGEFSVQFSMGTGSSNSVAYPNGDYPFPVVVEDAPVTTGTGLKIIGNYLFQYEGCKAIAIERTGTTTAATYYHLAASNSRAKLYLDPNCGNEWSTTSQAAVFTGDRRTVVYAKLTGTAESTTDFTVTDGHSSDNVTFTVDFLPMLDSPYAVFNGAPGTPVNGTGLQVIASPNLPRGFCFPVALRRTGSIATAAHYDFTKAGGSLRVFIGNACDNEAVAGDQISLDAGSRSARFYILSFGATVADLKFTDASSGDTVTFTAEVR